MQWAEQGLFSSLFFLGAKGVQSELSEKALGNA